jgi:hypothetical protein
MQVDSRDEGECAGRGGVSFSDNEGIKLAVAS